jgi:chemotaxis methyl-accepting protein methylase
MTSSPPSQINSALSLAYPLKNFTLDVSIRVTSFFRNPQAFETLKRKMVPKLIAKRGG